MTGQRLAVPPGRAGRLWLVRRLETARTGAGLLDRKLRILQAELARRQRAAAQAAEAWESGQEDARAWLLRAALLGGQRAIRLGVGGLADVTVSYAATMGIRYPSETRYSAPPPVTWDGPVLARAWQAHREALAAAVGHAAAAAALQVIEAEALATRYRLRAVRDRWIPRLEAALAEVTFAIEEQERADAARLRRAGQRAVPGRQRTP
jgi:V/A-type H+-transporting ATPase subunit D